MAKEGVRFGEFWLTRKIGAGGMAEVFLARREGPRGFEKQLVVKRLLPHLNQRPKFTRMFLREARYAALIDHPNFAHVSAFGEADGHFYLAMEYVDGFTLRELLTVVGSVTPGVAVRIGIDLLDGLHAVHTATDLEGRPVNLVHRDITPRNVMITGSGTVKLLDLGIAVSEEDNQPVRAGTRRYMSPEQQRALALDARSDLYCVGLLLRELLAGNHAKDGETTDEAIARAPSLLAKVITRLLSEDPNERPDEAQVVRDELEQFALTCGVEGTRGFLARFASRVVKPSPGRTANVVEEKTMSVVDVAEFGTPASTHLIAQPKLRRSMRDDEKETVLHVAVKEPPLPAPKPKAVESRPAEPTSVAPPPVAPPSVAPPPVGRTRAIVVIVFAAIVAGVAVAWLLRSIGARPPPPAARGTTNPVPNSMTVANTTKTVGLDAIEAADPVPKRRPRRRTKKRRKRREATIAAPIVAPGFLSVDARPWADVYVDGRHVGQTPLSRLSIAAGRHEVRLVNTALDLTSTSRVVVKPNKTVRIRKIFESPDKR